MSINIYFDVGHCSCCGRADAEYHVGKFNAGWVFALHLIPEEGLNTLQDWTDLITTLRKDGNALSIHDDYGNRMSWNHVLSKIAAHHSSTAWEDRIYDFAGMCTEEKFHQANLSERGPDNLLRRKIDGAYCVSHGPKWDGIVGNFS